MAAESSLLELIEAMLTLASQSQEIFPPKPAIKPGGYPEDIFASLSEQEKEDFACAICYQILKEPMRCANNHKFCHSCIYVWATTGVHMNRTRCPVCRCSCRYQRCVELDNLLGEKPVKCNKTACKWTGSLKFFNSHRHTYTDKKEGLPTGRDILPNVRTSQRLTPVNSNHLLSRESPEPMGARVRAVVRVNPILRLNMPQSRTPTSMSREPQGTLPRESLSATGDSITNGETSEEVVVPLSFTPRPPSGPRPLVAAPSHRRTPTLPSLMTPNTPRPRPSQSSPSLPPSSSSSTTSAAAGASGSGGNGGALVGGAAASLSPPPAGPWRPRFSREQNQRDAASLGSIRQRLQENRHRLDSLMASFSGELERSRQEAVEFQQERERLRRQQLEEVREMGRRLGHVAFELRRLLNDRQRPAPMASSDSDSDLDDLLS